MVALNEQIENLRDNMTFIQENINECQIYIVHMEELKVYLPTYLSIFVLYLYGI